MKVIKVKSCLTCPYLRKLISDPHRTWRDEALCGYKDDYPQAITEPRMIPDWCPLEDE